MSVCVLPLQPAATTGGKAVQDARVRITTAASNSRADGSRAGTVRSGLKGSALQRRGADKAYHARQPFGEQQAHRPKGETCQPYQRNCHQLNFGPARAARPGRGGVWTGGPSTLPLILAPNPHSTGRLSRTIDCLGVDASDVTAAAPANAGPPPSSPMHTPRSSTEAVLRHRRRPPRPFACHDHPRALCPPWVLCGAATSIGCAARVSARLRLYLPSLVHMMT